MAQFAGPAHLLDKPAMILVSKDEKGGWGVFNNHEQMDGVFADREEALRFARLLRASLPGSIIIETADAVRTSLGTWAVH